MKTILLLLAIVGLLLPLGTASATVMEKQTVSSLSRQSISIVIGTITDIRTVIIQGEPWTIATVVPEKLLKGHSSGLVYFRIPGGRVMVGGRMRVTEIDGAPRLSTLQRAVFFFSGQPPEYFNLSGLSQGFRPIHIQNGKEVVCSSEEVNENSPLLEDFIKEIRMSLNKETQ